MVPKNIAEFLKENVKGRTIEELTVLVNKRFGKNYKTGTVKKYKEVLGLKKGERSYRRAPLGTERLILGYIRVKFKQPDKWAFKHRIVWENANGKIPEGYRLVFLDNNKLNVSLENLALVSLKEQVVLSKLQAHNAELSRTMLNVIRLKDAVLKKKEVKNERIL